MARAAGAVKANMDDMDPKLRDAINTLEAKYLEASTGASAQVAITVMTKLIAFYIHSLETKDPHSANTPAHMGATIGAMIAEYLTNHEDAFGHLEQVMELEVLPDKGNQH